MLPYLISYDVPEGDKPEDIAYKAYGDVQIIFG